MPRILLICAAFLVAEPAMLPQPAVSQNGVVNAASGIPSSLPGGSIGRGALFTISGVRLAESQHATVTIAKDGVSVQAKVLKAGPTRIDAWMPRSAPAGPVSLAVTTGGASSRPFKMEISDYNPGLFSRNGQGWGPAVADNVRTSSTRSPNTFSRPAHPGDTVALAATGIAGAKDVTVVIGNRTVKAGPPRPLAEGREEVQITLPADAPVGCSVPVFILVTPTQASNVVTLAVGPGGLPCPPWIIPAEASKRIGVVALSRVQVKTLGKKTLPEDPGTVLDDARVSFITTGKDQALTPLRLLPPLGACTAYTASFQANADLASSITTIVSPDGRGLDAGTSLTLSRAGQTKSIGQGFETPGRYRARLASSGPRDRKGGSPLFLLSGEYLLRGSGGKDVGPFSVGFHLPEPPEWTDRDQISVVDRARGITVHWSGTSPNDVVLIVARNVDQVAAAIGTSICAVPAAVGEFAIPPAILFHIPASSENPGESYDELAVGTLTSRAPIKALGLDTGSVMSVYLSERFVRYR